MLLKRIAGFIYSWFSEQEFPSFLNVTHGPCLPDSYTIDWNCWPLGSQSLGILRFTGQCQRIFLTSVVCKRFYYHIFLAIFGLVELCLFYLFGLNNGLKFKNKRFVLKKLSQFQLFTESKYYHNLNYSLSYPSKYVMHMHLCSYMCMCVHKG